LLSLLGVQYLGIPAERIFTGLESSFDIWNTILQSFPPKPFVFPILFVNQVLGFTPGDDDCQIIFPVSDQTLWNQFIETMSSCESLSWSIHSSQVSTQISNPKLGTRNLDLVVHGVAISMSDRCVYYIPLDDTPPYPTGNLTPLPLFSFFIMMAQLPIAIENSNVRNEYNCSMWFSAAITTPKGEFQGLPRQENKTTFSFFG
jgi:hypothetical protein